MASDLRGDGSGARVTFNQKFALYAALWIMLITFTVGNTSLFTRLFALGCIVLLGGIAALFDWLRHRRRRR